MVKPMNEQAYQLKTWLNVIYDLVWKIRTFLWAKILIIKFKTFYDSVETLINVFTVTECILSAEE